MRDGKKSGKEVVGYLKNKYLLEELYDDNAKQVVINNVLYNKPYANKLPMGAELSAVTFIVENKDNGTDVSYYIFNEFEIHMNKIAPNHIITCNKNDNARIITKKQIF